VPKNKRASKPKQFILPQLIRRAWGSSSCFIILTVSITRIFIRIVTKIGTENRITGDKQKVTLSKGITSKKARTPGKN